MLPGSVYLLLTIHDAIRGGSALFSGGLYTVVRGRGILRSSRSRCALTADAASLLNSFRRRRDWRDPPRLDRES